VQEKIVFTLVILDRSKLLLDSFTSSKLFSFMRTSFICSLSTLIFKS
jgi:hypothetical protein